MFNTAVSSMESLALSRQRACPLKRRKGVYLAEFTVTP